MTMPSRELRGVHHLRPGDLGFCYSWRDGSVPPPDHYEYTICASPGGEASIVFRPDYPEHHPPAWEERFQISPKQLDELFARMERAGLFDRQWQENADAGVGGVLEWLSVDAGGTRFLVPSTPQEGHLVEPLYAFIRELVPKDVWNRLLAQHEEFRATYDDAPPV